MKGVQPQVWYAIGLAEGIYHQHGAQLVVTSLMDGTHMQDSLHYKGLATDLRTRGIAPETLSLIYQELVAKLKPLGYDCVMEGTHLHIEYQPHVPTVSWFTTIA